MEHALFADTPKHHCLVVPNRQEANWTIGQAAEEMSSLNADHLYSYSQEEILERVRALRDVTGNRLPSE